MYLRFTLSLPYKLIHAEMEQLYLIEKLKNEKKLRGKYPSLTSNLIPERSQTLKSFDLFIQSSE